MNGWIVPLVLYAVGFGFFALLGGLASAADAFRQWGRHTAATRHTLTSS